jgi:hypothetical protein
MFSMISSLATTEDAEDAEVQSCPFDVAQGTPSFVEG